MKINKEKQQKKLEKKYMMPNFQYVLALTVTKDTDVEDEEIVEDETGKKTIRQTIHGTKFVTETCMKVKLDDGTMMNEEARVELDVPEGTVLIWLEGRGYIKTNEQFASIEEIMENYNYLKE